MIRGPGVLLAVAIAAVCAAVVAGMSMLGSPATQRRQRLDSVRVEDLVTIERLIAAFAGQNKALPRDLASLARERGYSVRIHDPESGVPYGYEILGADSYRLCAIFMTRSSDAVPGDSQWQPFSVTWSHEIGRQCFNRHVERRISSDAQLDQKRPVAPVARGE